MSNVEKIVSLFKTAMVEKNVWGQIDFGTGDLIYFEPKTVPSGIYDGMICSFDLKTGLFQVYENQTGPDENEQWIYTKTKYPKIAIKSLLLGNKNRKIIGQY